jgi:hypothetical protein
MARPITTIKELCTRDNCSVRQANMTISLAFLAPNLVQPQKVACPAASASNGSAIRRLNGGGSLRRSDSILNN